MIKKIVSIILILCVLGICTVSSFAASVGELQDQKDETEAQMDEVTAEKNSVLDEISELNVQINKYEAEIEKLNNKIDSLEESIKENEEAIKELEKAYKILARYDIYKNKCFFGYQQYAISRELSNFFGRTVSFSNGLRELGLKYKWSKVHKPYYVTHGQDWLVCKIDY